MGTGIVIGLLIGFPLGFMFAATCMRWAFISGKVTSRWIGDHCDRLLDAAADEEPETQSQGRSRCL